MLSEEEVKRIADLSRIGLDEKETEKFSRDLSGILDWMEELKKADISQVKAAAHITELKNRSREDQAENFQDKDEITKLFPESKNGYDKVKSVL